MNKYMYIYWQSNFYVFCVLVWSCFLSKEYYIFAVAWGSLIQYIGTSNSFSAFSI